MPTEAVWAYAVLVDDAAERRIEGLRGVAGGPVRLLTSAGLAAAVGTVGLDEFGEEALRRNFEDLDWLAEKAGAHDTVISAIAHLGTVIPLRMATLYLDDERVTQLLEARHDDFVAALDRLAGRDEYGVKGYGDPQVLGGQSEAADVGKGQKPSGTAYLMRRRRALVSREEAYRVAAAEVERIHGRLMDHAVDGRRKPATDRSLSGRDVWTVLNGTYLVEKSEVNAFRAAVAALDQGTAGIELEVTGPWPPYSFAGDVVGQ